MRLGKQFWQEWYRIGSNGGRDAAQSMAHDLGRALDRRPRRGRRGLGDSRADRLQADPKAAGKQPRQHPLQRKPPDDLRCREQLVGRHSQLPRTVRRPNSRAPRRHAAPAQGHRAAPPDACHAVGVGRPRWRPEELRRLAHEGVEEAQDRLTQIIRYIK